MDPINTQPYSPPPPGYLSAPLLPQNEEKHGDTLPPEQVAVFQGYGGYGVLYPHESQIPAPGSFQPRRPRSRTRRLIVRAVHMLMLFTVSVMLLPTFLRGIARISYAFDDWRGPAEILGNPDLPGDCNEVAEWTVLDHHPQDLQDVEVYHPWYPYAAQTSLKLPVSSELLYFISRGSLSHGLVRVLDDGDDDSHANVTVTFLYDTEHLLEKAKVCRLQQEHDHNGVGIFTPQWTHRHDHRHRTFFLMDVHLPANKGSSPLHIQGFKTDMPLFRHAIADLADSVRFNSLMLSTSNVGIHSQSLLADRAELKSSNNAIVGNFTVRDTLVIRTSNSPIAANITMINGGEDKVTDVTLITSNSPLYSNFSLISTTKSENGGSFRVNTKTINSPLNVNFTSAPVDSLLHFKGATSNSPAYVSLHSTYEGSFTLRSSSLLQPRIEQREDVEDPAGKDRRRNVEIYSIRRGIAEGKVTWVPAETEKVLGSVGLRSSNMPVVLVV